MMASPIVLKRSFEEAGLGPNNINSGDSVDDISFIGAGEAAVLPNGSRPSSTLSSRASSPLSTTASVRSTAFTGVLCPPVPAATSTDTTGPAPKKRKLTFAEKEAQRIEKQFKDLAKAEEKAKKEDEKRLKEEQKRLKAEEAEEKRKMKEAEKAAKDEEKRKKDAEKAAKDAVREAERKAKEAEKKAKEHEKAKKERSQMKLGSFFMKPAAASSLSGSGPPSRRGSVASIEVQGDGASVRADSAVPEKSISEYEKAFPEFFLHTHTTLAPQTRFTFDEEYVKLSFAQIEQVFSLGSSSVTRGSLKESLRLSSYKRRKMYHISTPVRTIINEINGSAAKPIDLTEDSQKPQSMTNPLQLLRQIPLKFLKFREDVRPPYVGTFTQALPQTSVKKLSRNPFSRELPHIDYDYDSEAEWEEPEEGEDLDSEGEEEPEDDDEEDMEGFLDDDDEDAAVSQAKRRNIMGDVEPQFTALHWADDSSRGDQSAKSGDVTFGMSTINLRDFTMEPLLGEIHNFPIDPHSKAYWPSKASKKTDLTTPAPMAPPRVPLNPIPLVNGTSLPLQSALDLLAKQPQTAHSKASKPTTNSKPMPQEIMNDFKLAIEGSDLTKTGLIEVLKKKFPSVTKNTVVDTLAMVAKREGKKEAEKKWVLL